jgi:hypothetical protein
MSGFIRLRTELIKQLVSHGLTNFKVMDACCPANCSLTADLVSGLRKWKKSQPRTVFTLLTLGTKRLLSVCLPVWQQWWLLKATTQVEGNQLFISGVVSAVRGDRCCPEWATAITTHFPMWSLEVSLEAREDNCGDTEGTGRFTLTVSGSKLILIGILLPSFESWNGFWQ